MTQSPAFSLCVYCASRMGNDSAFADAAGAVGRWIGEKGGQLVYGGGNNGLMGVVANATLAAGGRVVGYIPRALVEREFALTACTELHVVETMHERKHNMASRADAFLALAGGLGTFEELFEVWTLRQLGYHDKPIGLLNTNGFYDELMVFLQSGVKRQFISPAQLNLLQCSAEIDSLLQKLTA